MEGFPLSFWGYPGGYFCIFDGDFPMDFPSILRKNQLGIHMTMESMESIAAIPVWNDGTAPEKSLKCGLLSSDKSTLRIIKW